MQRITRHMIKQAMFCLEYIKDFHGTNAWLRVDPESTETNAGCMATKLLKQDHIRKKIKEHLRARKRRVGMTADKAFVEMWDVAMSDVRHAFNADGTLKRIKDMPTAIAKAISSVKCDEITEYDPETHQHKVIGYTREVKFHSKIEALKNVGKNFGVFPDKVEHTGEVKHEHIHTVEPFDINERLDMYRSIN